MTASPPPSPRAPSEAELLDFLDEVETCLDLLAGLGSPDLEVLASMHARRRWLVSALPALLAARSDGERLDWLESQSWITLSKTDESDNNGVGLNDMAVHVRGVSPDGSEFSSLFAATFREAIDKHRAARAAEHTAHD